MTSVALGGRGRDEGSPGIAIRRSPRAGGPWVWCSDVCHGLRSVSGVLTFNVFLGKSLHSWHARADVTAGPTWPSVGSCHRQGPAPPHLALLTSKCSAGQSPGHPLGHVGWPPGCFAFCCVSSAKFFRTWCVVGSGFWTSMNSYVM